MQNFDPQSIVKRLDDIDIRLAEMETFKALLERTYSGDIAGVGASQALASKDAGYHRAALSQNTPEPQDAPRAPG